MRARVVGLVVASAVLALAVPVASAAPVTIGELAPPDPPTSCSGGPTDAIQASVSSPDISYVIPSGYTTITAWSTNAATGSGQTLKLKVFRPVAGSSTDYTVVAQDGPRALAPSTLNTFPVDIPVHPGDLVGLNDENATTVNNACDFSTSNGADVIEDPSTPGDTADGSTDDMTESLTDKRLNIAVSVAAPAAVASVTPASGPSAGGTTVVLGGHDFTGVTAVDFGGVPAERFTFNSDTQITAVAPPRSRPGRVDVTVTTPAGQSAVAATDHFTYTGCVVPKLKGKTLKKARRLLTAAHCSLGRVKPKHGKGKKLIVRSQSRAPGTVLAQGAKVSVKLGPKPHHKKH